MPNSLLSDVWDEARAFLAREMGLLAPVALMTFGFGALLFILQVPQPVNGRLPEGDWIWWVLPFALLNLLGAVAISMLAMRPGCSVGQALRESVAILPRAIGTGLIIAAAGGIAMFVVLLVLTAAVGSAVAAAQQTVSIFSLIAVLFSARIALSFPLLAEGRGAITSLTESWRRTAPVKWRLTLLLIAYSLVSGIILVLLQLSIGSALILLGKLVGMQPIGMKMAQVVTTFAWALMQMGLLVYCALLARRLLAKA